MKRYNVGEDTGGNPWEEERPDGEWVKAEEALEALARLKAWMEIMAYVAPEHLQERLLAEYALTRAFLEEAEA